jgi:hypothetical protein
MSRYIISQRVVKGAPGEEYLSHLYYCNWRRDKKWTTDPAEATAWDTIMVPAGIAERLHARVEDCTIEHPHLTGWECDHCGTPLDTCRTYCNASCAGKDADWKSA